MKTTWNLELRSAKATREARAFRRELQSLQGMLEQVDSASARLNATLGRMASPAAVQRRVRGERAVAREVRSTYDAHRVGHRRVSQDIATQQKIRGAVDRAQRSTASRSNASADRAWQAELRRVNRVGRADIARDRRSDASWRRHMRAVGRASLMEQREIDRVARTRDAAAREAWLQNRASRRAGVGAALGGAGLALGVAGGIVSTTLSAAGAFASMAATAAQLTLSIGESVLQMIAFREASLATLRLMNRGNASVAAEQYSFARQFARETPLDTQQVLELQQQVSTAGFRGQQNRDVVLAGADVGAANPNDSTAASRYVRALSQIRNAGRLRAQEMNQLGEVGVGRHELLLALGSQTNVRRGANENDDAYVARLQRMQESGRFTGDQGVAAAQDVVRRQFSGGGALGSGARSQGDTLLGTLSNVRGAVFDLFTGIDRIEQLPGIRLLKGTLNSIANTIAGVTPTGKRLQGIVSTIVNDVSMLVGSGLGDFDATLNSTLDAGKDFLPIVREVARAFGGGALAQARRDFGGIGGTFRETFGNPAAVRVAGVFGRSLVSLFGMGARFTGRFAQLAVFATIGADAVLRLLAAIDPQRLLGHVAGLQVLIDSFLAPVTLGDQLRARMMGPGAQAVLGLRQGIQSALPGLRTDVAAMANAIPTTTTQTLAIKSPSRVMADEVGRFIPLGIAAGIEAGRGPLDQAMAGLVGPGDVGAAGGLGGMGRGLSIGSLTIQVGAGATEETGRDVARGFLDELVALLEVPAIAG